MLAVQNHLINKIIFYIRSKISFRRKIVLGRAACLGKDVFLLSEEKSTNLLLINQQKARADLLLDWINGSKRPNSKTIQKYLARKDIRSLITEQESMPWENWMDFDYILMDSFSELTDLKFKNKKEDWAFCAHYSDIKHSEEFENLFECNGLLNIDEIEITYENLFKKFNNIYPNKKIIFLHFPTTLDTRGIYKERGFEILRSMESVAKRYSNIINITVDEKYVDWHENDKFQYHYSRIVYKEFSKKWINEMTK